MDKLYQIISNDDLAFLVLTNINKVYTAEWFFKTNFEKNGFISNLNNSQYKEICSYIDSNFIHLVKSFKKKKTIYTNSQSIDCYFKFN